MINIQLRSTKESFEILGHKFNAYFSDTSLKKFWDEGSKVNESDEGLVKRHGGLKRLDDPESKISSTEAYRELAAAALDSIPTNCEAYKKFFDSVFGQGKGEEIYELCGRSTPNMGRVFEVVWQSVMKHMYARTETRTERRGKK
jgi:hypothetical protein